MTSNFFLEDFFMFNYPIRPHRDHLGHSSMPRNPYAPHPWKKKIKNKNFLLFFLLKNHEKSPKTCRDRGIFLLESIFSELFNDIRQHMSISNRFLGNYLPKGKNLIASNSFFLKRLKWQNAHKDVGIFLLESIFFRAF